MNRSLLIPLSAVAACALSSAMALELPQMKPGMWETSFTSQGKSHVSKTCFTPAEIAHSKEVGDAYVKDSCSKYEVRKDGGKWIVDMVCKVGAGPGTMTSHVESTFSDSANHMEMTATLDPPRKDHARTMTVTDVKYLGPC
jgi:Protein of unknown function (DUF3617)